MKKIFLVTIMLLLCACGNENNIYEEIESSGYGVGWGGNPDGLVCEEVKDAIYLTSYFFLTQDGRLFKFNETKLFSNDKNCIEYSYEGNRVKYVYNNGLYDNNYNMILRYNYSDLEFQTEAEYLNEYGGSWYNPLEHIKADYDYISLNSCADENIMYIKGHNIYKYNYHRENEEYIVDEPLSLGTIPKDEKILYMAGAIIKTDKNYYELTRTNAEECNKYVDVKCEYAFKRSELSDIYDKILFVSQDYVIDDKYRMYGKGSCYGIE